jgi:D-sedoheptulose 7-phosphate isomerase
MPADQDLHALVAARFERSAAVSEAFFTTAAQPIAQACWDMARRFHQGGRLLAFGNGAWATDAQHVSVEFVHPVIVGKRALPAIALTNDSAVLSGLSVGQASGVPFVRQLAVLARPQDIALGFSLGQATSGIKDNVLVALAKAKEMGLLTLGFTASDGGQMARPGVDYCFAVPSDDPLAVQETHETLYHVLWELVHLFFEHEGLLDNETMNNEAMNNEMMHSGLLSGSRLSNGQQTDDPRQNDHCTDDYCLTCGDVALPARVLEVDLVTAMAVVEINGETAEVDISLVDDVLPGRTLLVHGGVALETVESGE